jgi:hypothetical protein
MLLAIMEQIKIANNIKRGFITMSDLKFLITTIFEGKTHPHLEVIGNNMHPTGQTNNEYHLDQINKLIENVYKSYVEFKYNDKILSRISIQKLNQVNIDVHIHVDRNDPDISFYIMGPDLKYYYMFLPSNSITGTHNSKWYSLVNRELMTHIALNLRLLEIMLFTIKLKNIYDNKKNGILGLEVPFEIPNCYKTLDLINNQDNIMCRMNPIKVSKGRFLYGKNIVYNNDLNKIISYIRQNIVIMFDKIYPTVINTYDLNIFVSSYYTYAITSWNNHARIIIKYETDNNILIIDPWMEKLPYKVKMELDEKNKHITCSLLNRHIRDQDHEGSCGFCAFSRLLYIVDNEQELLSSIINKPIPDFYAYAIKMLYLRL